jgi:Spy/CpxP family protein refolding chaperone
MKTSTTKMPIISLIISSIITLAFSCVVAMGQENAKPQNSVADKPKEGKSERRGGKDRYARLLEDLNLNESQKASVNTILTTHFDSAYDEKMKRYRELRQQQGQNSTTQNPELETLRTELDAVREKVNTAILAVLTPEQAEKFKQKVKEFGKGRRRG